MYGFHTLCTLLQDLLILCAELRTISVSCVSNELQCVSVTLDGVHTKTCVAMTIPNYYIVLCTTACIDVIYEQLQWVCHCSITINVVIIVINTM